MALRAFPPAVGPVFAADFAQFDQGSVAGGANIVVAYCGVAGAGGGAGGGDGIRWGRVAGAMEASVGGWNGVGADVAVGCEGQWDVVSVGCGGGDGGARC